MFEISKNCQNHFSFLFAKLEMDPRKILETTKLLNIGIDEELLPIGSDDKLDDEAIELIQ